MEVSEYDKERIVRLSPYLVHLFDLLVGILLLAACFVALANKPQFGEGLIAIYIFFFAVIVCTFIFYVPPKMQAMVPFYFSYSGRGLVHLFLGVLVMAGSVPRYELGAGTFIVLVAVSYLLIGLTGVILNSPLSKKQQVDNSVSCCKTCKVPRPFLQRETGLTGVHYTENAPPVFELSTVNDNAKASEQTQPSSPPPPPQAYLQPVSKEEEAENANKRRETLETTNPFKSSVRTEETTTTKTTTTTTTNVVATRPPPPPKPVRPVEPQTYETTNPFNEDRRPSDAVEVENNNNNNNDNDNNNNELPPPPEQTQENLYVITNENADFNASDNPNVSTNPFDENNHTNAIAEP